MKKSKRVLSVILIMLVLSMLLATTALGASTSINFSSSSIKVGSTVTVTVTFSSDGQPIGTVDANATYDANVLQYVSGNNASGGGGTVRLVAVAGSDSQTTLQCTMTFKGLAAGASGVTISVNTLLAYDYTPITPAGASATVTVTSGGGGGTSSGGTSSGGQSSHSQSSQEEETPIEVTVGDKTLYLWQSFSGVELPDNYDKTEIEYGGKTVAAATGTGQTTILLYLTDENRENGAFYIYNEASGDIYLYSGLTTEYAQYTLLNLPSDTNPPDGWTATTIKIAEQTLNVYKSDNADYTGFYLMYAVSADGRTGLFLYDSIESTMQRFVEITPETVEVEPEPETQPEEPVTEPVQQTLWARIAADKQICLIMLLMAALAGGLLIANIVAILVKQLSKLSVKRRGKKNDKLRVKAEKINAKSKHITKPAKSEGTKKAGTPSLMEEQKLQIPPSQEDQKLQTPPPQEEQKAQIPENEIKTEAPEAGEVQAEQVLPDMNTEEKK